MVTICGRQQGYTLKGEVVKDGMWNGMEWNEPKLKEFSTTN